MAYKTSTGLRNYMLVTGSLKAALAGGFLKLYAGIEPATADDASTGTLLCTIGLNNTGAGVTLDTAVADGVVGKVVADVWSGACVASGTAGYYRHVGSADTGAASTTEPRIQGRIATTGAEMNLSSVALVNAAIQAVDYYTINLPTF